MDESDTSGGGGKAEAGAERRVFRVGELTRLIKTALQQTFGEVWVEGEVFNFHRHSSGHCYFTLKDADAQIAAVWFRGSQRGAVLDLRDGMKVRAGGELTVYEARGAYQIVVRAVEEAGRGSLLERFEQLKKKLAAEGLFDPAAKKPIPVLPRSVGVVTSPTGAVLRDLLNVMTRRFPNLHLLIAPVKVQGEGAAGQIARALDYLNLRGGLDVIIVARGGGSLEDLWCFNEEEVARAVARSRIPVISAVGHETDVTLCDFAADLRAPTPSAAAELVVDRKDAFEERLAGWRRRLAAALQGRFLHLRHRLTAAAGSYVFHEPRNLQRTYRQRIESLRRALTADLRAVFQQRQQRVDELHTALTVVARQRTDGLRGDLRRIKAQMRALNPLAVLERGYSITRRAGGGPVRDPAEVSAGDELRTRVARGEIVSRVQDGGREDGHGQEHEGRQRRTAGR